MKLDERVFERARRARDARFDGRFFIGVVTTGIYCRPVCPVAFAETGECALFPLGSGRRPGGLPAMPALPAGIFAGNARVAGKFGDGLAGAAS